VRPGQQFSVVVRQVTNAFTSLKNPPRLLEATEREVAASRRANQWRRVHGAFQLTIPVHGDRRALLLNEERLLSVMKWIAEAIPTPNRWYGVFERYLKEIGGRVTVFGGDPGVILPSPTGHCKTRPASDEGRGHEFTGKVSGLIFDHFGDCDGFILETGLGERRFQSHETEMEKLAERAWRGRLRVTVRAEGHKPHRPTSIVVHRPPAVFEHY
jgi:hypothetical protein